MTEQRSEKYKRKYKAPATVWLGETARASGDCESGASNVEGYCRSGELNQGGGFGYACITGPSNIGYECYTGGQADGSPGCSTGTSAP